MAPTWTREAWITEFVNVLTIELRPDLGSGKFARAIAVQQWTAHGGLEPAVAARRWAAQSAKSPKRR
jgi:hypothetical protein